MSKTPVELAFERHVELVAKKDRAGFIANFHEDAVVEDPVGASPLDPSGKGHCGHAAILAFWDEMIAPGDVRFAIDRAYVCGNEIANVGTVYNRLEGQGEIAAEGVFVYRVADDGRLLSIRAFWDYDTTMAALDDTEP